MNTKRNKKGFTLIELLVVISIISLTGSLVLAALNTARAKARDAKILADVRSLVTALDLYYNDYGQYPPFRPSSSFWWGNRLAGMYGDATAATFKDAISPYMKTLPNPGSVARPGFKFGTSQSRISYSRPYFSWATTNNEVSQACFGGMVAWGESGRCYILYIITETETPLGPPNVPISLLNGRIVVYPYEGYDPDEVWWGFW